MIYCKYKFTDKQEFETLFNSIFGELPGGDIFTVGKVNFYLLPNASKTVEEGEDAVTTKLEGYHVDIVWEQPIEESFNQHEVFPEPIGVHGVMGLDSLYEQRYNEKTFVQNSN